MIVIAGPTASGKSSLAISVAKRLNGEIISADSMQIYRGMNVGTAKITADEMQGIPHYMIDVVNPEESFSVAQFHARALELIEEIKNRGRVPIVCGGTGLYINALIYNYHESVYEPLVRARLLQELEEKGIDVLYEKLQSLDKNAEIIDKRNVKRVVRALEVVLTEGKSILDKEDKASVIPHLMYAYDMPREELYRRINFRVDEMFDKGLVEEVRNLYEDKKVSFDCQSMQAIGYKEFRAYFDGEISLEEVKKLIQQHTRNYAKRQITWFKRIDSCVWLDFDKKDDHIDRICNDYYNNNDK